MATPSSDPLAPKVFISYSWDDDGHTQWVEDFATRLMKNGVKVTLDRWHAGPGKQLPAFMASAVRENDFVVAVCTPPYKEKFDRSCGGVGLEGVIMMGEVFTEGNHQKFIPVLRHGRWQEAAPSWFLGGYYIDLSGDPYTEARYEDLLRTLHGARKKEPPLGPRPDFGARERSSGAAPDHGPRIFQAPPLPPHFIARPEVGQKLKDRLLASGPAQPGVLVLSAIQGMGGIGKSTLAAAVVHEPEVQARFSDGILWATLGQQPDLLTVLSEWVQALGDFTFKPVSIDSTSRHLRTLLREKSVLLVVDDVWEPAHVPHFLAGGPRCRVLITTRRTIVAEEAGAEPFQLDVLTPEQSLALLATHLGRTLGPAEREDALRLAASVGFLPQALELAAARVRRGTSWTELRSALEAEVARLEELEDPLRRRKGQARLKASFNYSLKALRAEEQEAYEAFAALGVLPEDAVLAAPVAATLWDVEEAEAAVLLDLLWGESLLLPGAPVRVRERTLPTYRLHDLLHDLARHLLTSPSEPTRQDNLPGLGLTLSDAHGRLLEHYRTRTREGLWHTVPDDGYIPAHLTWHLERAGPSDDLHRLLCEETAEGRNGWYETREGLGQVAGYLSDLARARGVVERSAADEPRASGLQCRYALMMASLNSLAANIPSALLVGLVTSGRWLPSQGLAYARQIPDASRRAETFSRLFPHMTEHERNQILSEVHALGNGVDRDRSLAILAPRLAEMGSPTEALEAARAIGDKGARSETLAILASRLAELGSPAEALEAARAIGDEGARSETLAALVPHLPPVERDRALREALEAARAIWDGRARSRALAPLAPRLAELGFPTEALEAARAIGDKGARSETLGALAPHLPPAKRMRALREALEAARAIGDKGARSRALAALAPHLPPALLGVALEAARAIGDKGARSAPLGALAPHLPPAKRMRALREALEAARAIGDKRARSKALAALAPHLPPAEREQALCEALEAARAIGDEGARSRALAALTPHLPPALLGVAMETARAIGDEWRRSKELAALAPRLAELGFPTEALEAARAIGDKGARSETLGALAPHLPPAEREQALREALEAARAIGDEGARSETLAALAPHLPPALLGAALEAARAIGDEGARSEALAALAPHLPPAEREQALREALEAARAIGDEGTRSEALAALAPHLPPAEREQALCEALEATRAIEDEERRSGALAKLAPRLAELGSPTEALEAVRAIGDDESRSEALAKLAPHLPPALLGAALEVARAIGDEESRSRTLAALAPRFALLSRETLFPLWNETLQFEATRTRHRLLTDLLELIPVLSGLGGAEALAEFALAIQDVGRWWP